MPSQGTTALLAILAATIAVVSFVVFEPGLALISCLLGWTMLAIAVVDARRFIVPDVLSLPAIPAGLIVAWMLDDGTGPRAMLLEHLAAAALGAVALYAVRWLYAARRGREGLGLGDVKLAAAAGAWTGLSGLGHVLLLASVLAIFSVLVAHLKKPGALRGSTVVAFGVFLAPSIWFVWCVTMLGVDLGLAGWLAGPR